MKSFQHCQACALEICWAVIEDSFARHQYPGTWFSGSSWFLTSQDCGFLSFGHHLDQVFLLPTVMSRHTAIYSVLYFLHWNNNIMHMEESDKQKNPNQTNQPTKNPNVSFYNGLIKLLYHNRIYHQVLRICVFFSFDLACLKEHWYLVLHISSGHVCSKTSQVLQ